MRLFSCAVCFGFSRTILYFLSCFLCVVQLYVIKLGKHAQHAAFVFRQLLFRGFVRLLPGSQLTVADA